MSSTKKKPGLKWPWLWERIAEHSLGQGSPVDCSVPNIIFFGGYTRRSGPIGALVPDHFHILCLPFGVNSVKSVIIKRNWERN